MSRARTILLPAFACALALAPAAVAGAQAPTCPGADTPAVAGNEAAMDQATLCLLDGQRAAAGLPALTENAQLDQTSTAYSHQMVTEQFFDHTSPEGQTVVDRLTAIGYLPGEGNWNAGENIAWGQGSLATPESIMTAWMNSAGHRANILSPNFADVGVGVAIGTPVGTTMASATYTTDFGRHVAPAPASTSSTPSPKAPAKPKAKAPAHHISVRCARTATVRRHGHVVHVTRHTCRVTKRRR